MQMPEPIKEIPFMEVESLEELLDNMFNKEFLEMVNPMAYFGLSLAIKLQHNNEYARNCVFKIQELSINNMQSYFDRLIEKGVIPPLDTKTVATIFMCYVIVGNDISIHEYMGTKSPDERREQYKALKEFLTSVLQ